MNDDENKQDEMSDDTRISHQDWVRSLVECHAASLTRYAISITGDIDSARDIVQETFYAFVERSEKNKLLTTKFLFSSYL